jgi:glycosyltransferase involved in cell wall biosynthesis
MRIAIVAVFLNEERYLPDFLDSLAQQARPPDRVVLVDDGSTDGSAAVADRFAAEHPWAEVLRRPMRAPEPDRLASASVWTAFQWAAGRLLAGDDYDVIAKVDADLRLTPRTVAEVEAALVADSALGLTGPYLAEAGADGRLKRLRWRPEHVGGAVKFYRRECWEQVYPLPPLLNLDMMDEVKARSRGWRTASFECSDGDPLHLRPHGTHDGTLRGYRRWGRGDYVSGSHPLLVAFVGLQRLPQYPPVVGSLNYFAGWAAAALRRSPRFDPALRALRRQEQLERVRDRSREVARRWARGRSCSLSGAAGPEPSERSPGPALR